MPHLLRPSMVHAAAAVFAAVTLGASPPEPADQEQGAEGFRFRSGIDLVNVTATVTDASGRFVSGLGKEDFRVYEDGALQPVTHFSNERVPVSLGIALDTSGSMAGDKIASAQNALDRFLYELLDRNDEIFLYHFGPEPELLQEWTTDRRKLSRALGRIVPHGGTAMYDTVAEAVPLAQSGTNRKKALLLISDGNDTASRTGVRELKQLIRETEVMVYAIGIDGEGENIFSRGGIPPIQPPRIPFPFPIPGRRSPWPLHQFPGMPQPRRGPQTWRVDDRVNVAALRELTDDSGGRTEIIRTARDLDPATANIADELSKQYFLGYPAGAQKDGRWHAIRVEVRNSALRVRARRGYVAS